MTIDEMKLQTLQIMYDLEVKQMMDCVDRVNDLKCQMMEVEKRMEAESYPDGIVIPPYTTPDFTHTFDGLKSCKDRR